MNTILERITQAVADAQREGEPNDEIAAVLISFAARYALAIGWGPEKVANGQRLVLAEHLAELGTPADAAQKSPAVELAAQLRCFADDIEREGRSRAPAVMREAAALLLIRGGAGQ